MSSSRLLYLLAVPAAAITLASCGSMQQFATTTGDGFGKVAEMATAPFGPRIPVVEAREDDLREVRSGHQQAVAFEQRRRGFWIFGGPVDFTEPELPDNDGFVDGGLLPPKLE